MTPTVLAAEGNAAVTMSTEIKTAITTACQSAVDVCKDGIVAVLPIGLSLMAITMGIRMGCRLLQKPCKLVLRY